MSDNVKIMSEGTPNPNALKFILDRTLLETGSANFSSEEKAAVSPLALALFKLNDVEEVFLGKNFITVTKKEGALWESIYNKVIDTITDFFSSGEEVLVGEVEETRPTNVTPGSEKVVEQILEILDAQIRPAVAGDGGDVIFDSYEDGILKLHLQGACSSCPSSTMTLKHGIEMMLKRHIPEIKEVISA